MNATALLLLLIGIFIIVNAPNFVGVLNGSTKIGQNTTISTPQSNYGPNPGGNVHAQ